MPGCVKQGRQSGSGLHIRHARLDDATPLSVKACQSRPRLATLERYVQGRPGRQGLVQARWVVELAEPATGSWMEAALRMILIEGGLPRPRVQVPRQFAGRFHCTRRPALRGGPRCHRGRRNQPPGSHDRRKPAPEPPAARRLPGPAVHPGRGSSSVQRDRVRGPRSGSAAGFWKTGG